MAEDGKVVYKIEGDASQAMKAVDQFEKHAKSGAQNVENAAKEAMTNTESTVITSADKIAAAIGSAFATKKIIEFGKYAVSVASDLSEVQNVVDTTFGPEGAQRINEWAMSAAEAFGESELQAKQFTSTIGAMFKSMGLGQKDIEDMSIGIAGLAGDMASFYNLDPTEAFEKLRAGISGETEPLKQLGINMNVVNLEAYAMSQGITTAYEEMSQAEQATLRYQYIMQATADAQGDFSKTSDSFANQTRIAKLELETLAAEIGQDLLPVATELVGWARDAIEWGTEHKEVLEAVAGAVVALTAAYATYKATIAVTDVVDTLVSKTSGIASSMLDAKSGVGKLMAAFSAIPIEAKLVIAAIAAIIAIVKKLKDEQEAAVEAQLEYMDSLTSLQDLRAAGYMANGENADAAFEQYERDLKAGKFNSYMNDNGSIDWESYVAAQGGYYNRGQGAYNISQTFENGSGIYNESMSMRHQSGEDFVMSDWTPAFLDYGERVLTRQENLAYTAMGGVEGMAQTASEPARTVTQTAPQQVQVGFKVEPREMAHVITPYVVDEMKRRGL